jgi:mannosyltransferase
VRALRTETTLAADGRDVSGPATPPPERARSLRRLILLLSWLSPRLLPSAVPGVLMFGIALISAGRPVLSWDEVATADVAHRTPGQIWDLMQKVDAVFGPYYFFMHFWTSVVGDTVLDLRLPSIIAMAGAVALAGELGRRLSSPLIGVMTGLLLCLIPNTSRYAAEARPYAFACLFSALAFLFLYLALERPGVWRWLGYGLSVVFLGLSHIIALTTLGAHLAVLCFHQRTMRSRRVVIGWCATVGAALLILLPVALLGMGQQEQQVAWVAPLTLRVLRSSPGEIVGSVEAGWLLLGLVLAAAWRPVQHLAEVALLAVVPIVVLAAASVVDTPLWVARYLLIVLAPAAMLAAVSAVGPLRGVAAPGSPRDVAAPGSPREVAAPGSPRGVAASGRLRGRNWEVVVRSVVVLAVFAFAAYPGQRAVRAADAKNGSDYRTAGSIIRANQQPGDGLVIKAKSRALRAGIDYYLRDDPGRPRDLLEQRSAAEVASLYAQEFPDSAAHVTGVRRVWLFVPGRNRSDPTTQRPELRALLQTQYQRIGLWHMNGATLGLYTLRS